MVASSSIAPARAALKGLDWAILRLFPVLGLLGLLIPLVGVGVGYGLSASGWSAQRLDMLEFWWMSVTAMYWALFVAALAVCAIAWAFRRGRSWLFGPRSPDSQ